MEQTVIRVTIEMVPGGIGEPREMATIEIHNDLEDSLATNGRRGSYKARFSRISQKGKYVGWYDRWGSASGINRNQSGAVYRILHQVLGDFLEK
jgi:hypothetical protein